MSTDKKVLEELLEKLERLYAGYATTVRSATDQYRLNEVTKLIPDYTYNPADVIIRENLIEHIGSLPMVAIELYPYIDNPEVDLGRALTMLAIHDIGELTVGDVNTFVKSNNDKEKNAEMGAALELLDPSFHSLYLEVENMTSITGQFAKSIDKIAPDILDYMVPVEVTVQRFKHFVGIGPEEMVDIIIKHKRPYMLWNPFLTEFHVMLVDKFKEKLDAYIKDTNKLS